MLKWALSLAFPVALAMAFFAVSRDVSADSTLSDSTVFLYFCLHLVTDFLLALLVVWATGRAALWMWQRLRSGPN